MVATVSSIQTGSETILDTDGTTINVTISAVTLSRAIVFMSWRVDNDSTNLRPARHSIDAVLTTTTNLQFTRGESAFSGEMTVEWTVVEFDTGVLNALHTGSVDRDAVQDDTTITAVVLAQTFCLTSTTTSLTLDGLERYYTALLTSTTNLRLESIAGNTPTTGECVVEYQIVEFNSSAEVVVQRGTLNIPSSAYSDSNTITSVDLTKAFIIPGGNRMNGSPGSAYYNRHPARLYFGSATSITAESAAIGSQYAHDVTYEVVELQGANQRVESFDVTITDTNVSGTASFTAMTDGESCVFGHMLYTMVGYEGDAAVDGFVGERLASVILDADEAGVTVERDSLAAGETVTLSGFAVDWNNGADNTIGNLMDSSLIGSGLTEDRLVA